MHILMHEMCDFLLKKDKISIFEYPTLLTSNKLSNTIFSANIPYPGMYDDRLNVIFITNSKLFNTLREYEHYAEDKDIGSILNNRNKALKGLVAHEVAHWHQIMNLKSDEEIHGELFQKIYKVLRQKFVN